MFNPGFPTASRVAQHDNLGYFHDVMILRRRWMGRLAGSKISFEWIVGVGDTIPIGREKGVGVDCRLVMSIAMRQGHLFFQTGIVRDDRFLFHTNDHARPVGVLKRPHQEEAKI